MAPPDSVIRRRALIEASRREERRELSEHLLWLKLRHMDGRTKPVDAITLEPVEIDRQKQPSRQDRLLSTARKFKGSKSRATIMTAVDAAVAADQARVDIQWQRQRLIALRADLELERNRRAVPKKWTARDVDLWLQGAYETLHRVPVKIWPKEYGSCMPVASDHRETEFADEVARAGQEAEIQPLFGMARLRALGLPEKFEIERMEAALAWPMVYLKDHPKVAAIVSHAAMWKALDITFTASEFRKLCKRKFGVGPVGFDRLRGVGLTAIAGGLNVEARRARRGTR